jgi:hypothetical protein
MKRQSRLLVWSASLPVLTFLITLLSLKWREVYQEVFAKGSVADSPLTLRHKEGKLTDVLLTDPFIKMIKGMSWESLLSQEISQTKKEVKQN